MKSKLIPVITYCGVFLVFSGVFYFIFSAVLPVRNSSTPVATDQAAGVTKTVSKTGVITFSGPKTAVCPINGELYTADEQKIWSTRRPLEVMIENHSDARPQSGLQSADIVYEAVAEGGITRTMAVFYCGAVSAASASPTYDVGPVRSARTYFLDLASEYGDYPLYAHVGGANCSGGDSASTNQTNCTTDIRARALEQISKYGWNTQGTWGDLNQFSLSYRACRREPERTGQVRATEHTMYCSTAELWNVAASRGLTNLTQIKNQSWDKTYRSWTFKQKDAPSTTVNTTKISFDFWPGYADYSVSWTYDLASNSYNRANAGKPHIDFNTQTVLNAKNVVVQYAKETRSIDEHGHLLYGMIGSGTGVLFQNGTRQDITWSKANRLSRTIFKDSQGNEVNFVPGKVWVEILPIGNKISYEGQS